MPANLRLKDFKKEKDVKFLCLGEKYSVVEKLEC